MLAAFAVSGANANITQAECEFLIADGDELVWSNNRCRPMTQRERRAGARARAAETRAAQKANRQAAAAAERNAKKAEREARKQQRLETQQEKEAAFALAQQEHNTVRDLVRDIDSDIDTLRRSIRDATNEAKNANANTRGQVRHRALLGLRTPMLRIDIERLEQAASDLEMWENIRDEAESQLDVALGEKRELEVELRELRAEMDRLECIAHPNRGRCQS